MVEGIGLTLGLRKFSGVRRGEGPVYATWTPKRDHGMAYLLGVWSCRLASDYWNVDLRLLECTEGISS